MDESDTRSAGFAAIPNWIIEDTDITKNELLVMLALTRFHGTKGVWPSHQRIAELARSSVSAVRATLKKLRDRGWVTWEQRTAQDGGLTSNIYTLHFLAVLPPSPSTQWRTPLHTLEDPPPPSGEEEDLDEQDLDEQPPPSPSASVVGTRNAKAPHSLPSDWQPNTGHKEYARANGLSLTAEVANFRTYYLHGTGRAKRYKKWDQAFYNWMRMSVQRLQERGKWQPRAVLNVGGVLKAAGPAPEPVSFAELAARRDEEEARQLAEFEAARARLHEGRGK